MFSAVTLMFALPVALPPSTPSPLKSLSLISGPAVGGGMSGGMTVGTVRVWKPFGTSVISGGGGVLAGGGGGGGGGGGSSSSMTGIRMLVFSSSATTSLTLVVAQIARAINPAWITADITDDVAPPRSFLGLLAIRLLNIG